MMFIMKKLCMKKLFMIYRNSKSNLQNDKKIIPF